MLDVRGLVSNHPPCPYPFQNQSCMEANAVNHISDETRPDSSMACLLQDTAKVAT